MQNRPIGIKNSGENICWANAALQAIFLKKDTELYRFLKEQTPDNFKETAKVDVGLVEISG